MRAESPAGFTLIELVITLSVLSIILALAAAGVGDTIRNAQLLSGADSVQNGLQLARAEAVKSNGRVCFILSSTGSWAVKYDGTNGNCSGGIVQGPTEASSSLAVTAVLSGVVFNGLGALVGQSASIDIKPSIGKCIADGGKLRCFRVTVSGLGQIKRCDPSLAASDPRSCY